MRRRTSATRPPGSTGKWHLIGEATTACGAYWIRDEWPTVPIESLPPTHLCGHCVRHARREGSL